MKASPAAAQSANEKINMVIAYSESECPVAQPGEVVVCEILVEEERYRIPSNLRYSDNPANQSLARQVDQIKYAGDFGAMSCEPAGAGGFTGCNQKFVEAWAKDRDEAEGVRFGQLIEKARQERLSEIDESAAAEQARVEVRAQLVEVAAHRAQLGPAFFVAGFFDGLVEQLARRLLRLLGLLGAGGGLPWLRQEHQRTAV